MELLRTNSVTAPTQAPCELADKWVNWHYGQGPGFPTTLKWYVPTTSTPTNRHVHIHNDYWLAYSNNHCICNDQISTHNLPKSLHTCTQQTSTSFTCIQHNHSMGILACGCWSLELSWCFCKWPSLIYWGLYCSPATSGGMLSGCWRGWRLWWSWWSCSWPWRAGMRCWCGSGRSNWGRCRQLPVLHKVVCCPRGRQLLLCWWRWWRSCGRRWQLWSDEVSLIANEICIYKDGWYLVEGLAKWAESTPCTTSWCGESFHQHWFWEPWQCAWAQNVCWGRSVYCQSQCRPHKRLNIKVW